MIWPLSWISDGVLDGPPSAPRSRIVCNEGLHRAHTHTTSTTSRWAARNSDLRLAVADHVVTLDERKLVHGLKSARRRFTSKKGDRCVRRGSRLAVVGKGQLDDGSKRDDRKVRRLDDASCHSLVAIHAKTDDPPAEVASPRWDRAYRCVLQDECPSRGTAGRWIATCIDLGGHDGTARISPSRSDTSSLHAVHPDHTGALHRAVIGALGVSGREVTTALT